MRRRGIGLLAGAALFAVATVPALAQSQPVVGQNGKGPATAAQVVSPGTILHVCSSVEAHLQRGLGQPPNDNQTAVLTIAGCPG